jgi:hypothetical protein
MSELIWKAESWRVFLSGLVILIPRVPFSIKIIIVMLLDRLDCYVLKKENPNDVFVCRTDSYHRADKIGDIMSYSLLWLYYLFYVESYIGLKIYITFLFIIRLIGTILFEKTSDKKWLIYFPNVFLESLLVIAILQDLNFSYTNHKTLYVGLLIAVIIFKLIQEILMHSEKFNFRKLLNIP